jgi:hydroxymethylbilane synthase
MTTLRLATRGSALALAQSRMIAKALRGAFRDLHVELIVIRTSGDERPRGVTPPPDEDKSRFVKEIERALIRADADLAVHSAKDLPGQVPDELSIVAVPERADPRDVICGAPGIEALPAGAKVGTASLRRRSQLLAARPDLRVLDLRGNVDTRLRRLEEGRYDAIVLAAAGLARLGIFAGRPISPDVVVPAPGQGCLALQARVDDRRTAGFAATIDHAPSRRQLLAERAVSERLGAHCHTPLGVHARAVGQDTLELTAFVGSDAGGRALHASLRGSSLGPEQLGIALADSLLACGAARLLAAEEAA